MQKLERKDTEESLITSSIVEPELVVVVGDSYILEYYDELYGLLSVKCSVTNINPNVIYYIAEDMPSNYYSGLKVFVSRSEWFKNNAREHNA